MNSAIITIIPKHDDACMVKDYRPTSCCLTLLKIISKVLANRLGMVLAKEVDMNQAAFVPGHNLHEHALLAFELIRGYSLKGGVPRCMVQMDIQKSYDSADWKALEDIMLELSFPNKFIKWIMILVSTMSYRYKINNQLSDHVIAKRGLRQDDILLFTRGDIGSVELARHTMREFSEATGLEANPLKCKTCFGNVDDGIKQEILRSSKIQEGTFPFKYLGIPISSKKLSINNCLGLVDKIFQRIRHWSSRFLSFASRTQLIQSVLFSICNFWIQCVPLPKEIIKRIWSIFRTFLWSSSAYVSRKSHVAWKKVCAPSSMVV